MAYLFFDIESFVDPDDNNSGLNPFYTNSKVIVISYNYYSSNSPPQSGEIKPPTFLFEWVIGSEKALLKEFFKVIKNAHKDCEYLKLVGFNHLPYDVPYLFNRMLFHKIAPEKELFSLLFTKARHVDLAQLGMIVSKATKRDNDFRCISQKAINYYYEIPVKEGSGKDVTEFYIAKQYAKIEKYCKEEFTFELLYNSLLETILHQY